MLWKFVAKFCPNFVIALSIVTIRRSETCRSGTVSISHTITWGMSGAWRMLQAYEDFFMRLIR